MLLLLSITGLILSPLLFFTMDRYRLRFGLMWFVAFLFAVGFWFFYLQQLRQLPVTVNWRAWGGELVPPALNEGWFSVDQFSWPLGFAITSLGLASLLTGLAGSSGFDWRLLGLNLSTQGFGLLGVLAAGIPAVAFSWMGYDVMELVVLLWWYRGRKKNRQALRAFSLRTVGTLMLLLPFAAQGFNSPDGQPVSGVTGWLLMAATVRIFTTPFQGTLNQEPVEKRGLFNLLRMVPVAAALSLALRFSQPGLPVVWQVPIQVVSVIVLGYTALGWLTAETALAGRQYWVVGIGMLSITAAAQGQSEAAVTWGLTLILGGSLLFTGNMAEGAIRWTYPMALLAICGLPYTPSWEGSSLFASGHLLLNILLLALVAVMLLAFYRHGMNSQPAGRSPISGVQVLYLFGILFIFAAYIFAGWSPVFIGLPFSGGWWQGVALLAFGGIFWYVARRGIKLPFLPFDHILFQLFPAWLLRIARRAYTLSSRGVDIISRALEGDGAVLWALLLLGLIFSAFSGL